MEWNQFVILITTIIICTAWIVSQIFWHRARTIDQIAKHQHHMTSYFKFFMKHFDIENK